MSVNHTQLEGQEAVTFTHYTWQKMLSTEKSLVSPWPTLSSLSLSTWPTPAPGNSSDDPATNRKKSWTENCDSNIASSKDVSPSFLSLENINSFSFEDLGSGPPCDLKIDGIDSLAAKLLSLSAADEGQGREEAAENKRHVATPSPGSSESEININVAASSSNSRWWLNHIFSDILYFLNFQINSRNYQWRQVRRRQLWGRSKHQIQNRDLQEFQGERSLSVWGPLSICSWERCKLT